jgi:hypothetical protein
VPDAAGHFGGRCADGLTAANLPAERCRPGQLKSLDQHRANAVYSLPSVDHPVHGRHIELGVKGRGATVAEAYAALLEGLKVFGAKTGPEMVR